jgi:ATP/maltotriose-dependent transcriptional regulator MalT
VLPGTLTKIEKGAQGRLLVVQAPAGYGKTTVLAYAARSLRWRTAWYKLDALDQDPMVFAASLVQSIRKRVPGFGTILEERLADIAEVPLSTSEALGILASELASEVDGELHIVLDDYHEAANSAGLNSAIDYLLGSMPDHLHVIVLTRYEPSFQLAKLRLSDDAAELREDDLRLGAEQVTAIIGERAGLSLVHDDVEALLRFTEGWAASVVLASKSLSSHELHALRDALEDPRLRVDVYSYLAEQVLAKESDRVQRFLKSTCCLEYMTPALADDVTDSSHTERFLDYLTAKGLFTLRTEEGNFRYHRLFRDYLRHRVAQDDGPAAFREQQLKAAAALSRTGDFQAAAELYFCAGHPALAAGAIARSGETGIDSCAADTLAGWAERLNLAEAPVAAYREYLEGHVLLRRGDYASALSSFRRAHHLLGEGQERRVRFLVLSAIERALFCRRRVKTEHSAPVEN